VPGRLAGGQALPRQYLRMGGDEDPVASEFSGRPESVLRAASTALAKRSWFDVFGLHAGRAVQQQDGLDGFLTDLLRERSCDGECDQAQGDELQQQKQVPLEPLEGLVRGEVSIRSFHRKVDETSSSCRRTFRR